MTHWIDLAAEGSALLLLLAIAIWALHRMLFPPARTGRAIAADLPALGGMRLLSSRRYRLSGRPDELRPAPNGGVIPVEIKSARAPRSGAPHLSHRTQLLAYCLLVEENYPRPPDHGILVYGDGTEFKVPWDKAARKEILGVLERWNRPYAGEMDPGPGKCHTCPFRSFCPGAKTVGAA